MDSRYLNEHIGHSLNLLVNMTLPTGVKRMPINPNEFDILAMWRGLKAAYPHITERQAAELMILQL